MLRLSVPVTAETRAMVLLAAQICEEKKATDTRILELDPMDAGFTDFFLVTSGTNTRQTGAIADEIELRLKREFGTYAKSVEGRRQGEWILLDYVDFVVHVFTEQTREFYDIERLRKSARNVATHELAAALNEKTAAARKQAPAGKAAARQPGRGGEAGELGMVLHNGADALIGGADGGGAPGKKAAKKSSAKKAAKKAPAKKAAAKAPAKSAGKKAPAKKAVGKSVAKKVAAPAPNAQDRSPRALPSGSSAKRLPAPGSGTK